MCIITLRNSEIKYSNALLSTLPSSLLSNSAIRILNSLQLTIKTILPRHAHRPARSRDTLPRSLQIVACWQLKQTSAAVSSMMIPSSLPSGVVVLITIRQTQLFKCDQHLVSYFFWPVQQDWQGIASGIAHSLLLPHMDTLIKPEAMWTILGRDRCSKEQRTGQSENPASDHMSVSLEVPPSQCS